MLALRTAQGTSDANETSVPPSCTPNILPCKIHYDGPVDTAKRYWNPVKNDNGDGLTAYFRGRKLRGRRIEIPEGYRGVVAIPIERTLLSSKLDKKQNEQSGAIDGDLKEEPVKILETQTTFDDFVVWSHEVMPAADDSFVKGVEEWMKFAEVMHSGSAQPAVDGKVNGST